MSGIKHDVEFWNQMVEIKISLIALLTLHGNLCLALRHPQNVGESRKIVEKVVTQIGDKLVELKALTPEQLKHAERIEREMQNK